MPSYPRKGCSGSLKTIASQRYHYNTYITVDKVVILPAGTVRRASDQPFLSGKLVPTMIVNVSRETTQQVPPLRGAIHMAGLLAAQGVAKVAKTVWDKGARRRATRALSQLCSHLRGTCAGVLNPTPKPLSKPSLFKVTRAVYRSVGPSIPRRLPHYAALSPKRSASDN